LELYGPVVIDGSSPLSLGAEVGSNNTGELSAIGEALLWLRDEAPLPWSAPAVIHYDSEYAANIATRRNTAHKNQALAATVQALLDEVRAQRSLELSHVKGHSGVLGNELADRLASKGAEGHHSSSSKRWRSPHALALTIADGSVAASDAALGVAGRLPASPAAAMPASSPHRLCRRVSSDGEPAAKVRRLDACFAAATVSAIAVDGSVEPLPMCEAQSEVKNRCAGG
jgi:ribonuclease HI